MPELVEVEAYRDVAALAIGREIQRVDAPDAWFLNRGLEASMLPPLLVGHRVTDVGRVGKLLLLHLDGDAPTLGLRFGMTGRLIVDGRAGVDELLYSSRRDAPEWDRFSILFTDGVLLRMNDPRRLGGVELDPPVDVLGPDARTITRAALSDALRGSAVSVKARLLDQRRIAGIGNLLGDELLWRAGLAPTRPAGELTTREVGRLHRAIVEGVADLIGRGGSHTGDLMPERHAGGRCPRDGTALVHATIGGRTSWWCPRHQR